MISDIIDAMVAKKVSFVVVGGMAAISHGSSRITFDLDVCYARDKANLERLARALAPMHPSLRGAPAGSTVSLGR